jgi:hypothetical protein
VDSVPSFVLNQGKSCKFLAYYTEPIIEKGVEVERSRAVEITFHTEDNTMEIVEPKVRNSGLVQVCVCVCVCVCFIHDFKIYFYL